MVGVSVVQVATAVRHTPLPSLVFDAAGSVGTEDSVKGLGSPVNPHHVLGGFVGGGQLAWRAAGPTVEIIEPDRGTRKAAWTFGAVLHNNGAQVTSVCGVGKGLVTHVVVGVDLGVDRRPRGLVALLSLLSSRVTRAFHFEHKVTKLCMVSGGEVSVDSGTLAPELRHWQGLLVVGTAHGTLHLLDLALDLGCHKVLSDEVSPGGLLTMTTPDPAVEHTRVTALMQQCHPTMCLSDGMIYSGRFHLIGPDDNVLFEVSSHQVFVTALAFFPQLASLVVGYNFGAFQIINLSSLTIDCASPYEENMPPVLCFACQEPENDPKNFVYLWLCRSWTAEGVQESSKAAGGGQQALCTMYAMSYDSKVWIEGHGLWYQGLASISPRYEFDVLGGLGLKGHPVGPSRVFSALTVQLTTSPAAAAASAGGPSPVAALTTPDEDSSTVLEQSLCLFGWVGGVMEKGCLSFNHYLAVFDINQWYQAHMPSTLKLEESHLCPFMSFHLLDRVPGLNADGSLSEVVLSAVPKPASWAQHTSHTCNDSDWFPAALSYDAHVLTSDSLVEYRCQSAQQAALALLTSCGPAAIVSPEEAHAVCVFAGLIPADSHHNNVSSAVSSMMLEREALLNVALDQQLVSLLVQCVTEFSEGRFTNLGCSLPSLLDWAWAKVYEIKTSSDSLCLPLFDPDCGVVSSDNIALLHQNLTSLTTLSTIVTTIRDHAHSSLITLQGAGELEGRVQVVRLVVLHLGAVLWFYHCGLLTPSPIEDPSDECSVPFPAELLSRIYKNRRMEIRNLSASLHGGEILMIDGLLEEATEESGGSIGKAWEEEEAGSSCSRSRRVYPPPSLHALLNMFLLPDVPTTTKHRIVQYLFLDLASLLSDGYVRIVEELVKYPSSFSLSPSLIKLTQAFWLLDHKDFQEGLNVLLDPLVNPCDITPWQHRRIMKAFLYQGEHVRALTYAKMRQPPKVDIDDIRLHLTLLLANGLVREAFHYQRSHRTTANTQDLLQHFYTGCEQQGRLESVIHLPLSSLEEAALVDYLRASASTAAHDYLLVYYLQRARYDDAALLQDSLRGGLGTARRRHGARSALVHGYLTHLPDVARRLSSGAVKRPAPVPKIYKKPPPLSAHIRQSTFNTKSRATSLESQMSSPPRHTDPFTPFKTAAQRRRAYELADLDNYEVLVTPKKKESRDTSHVVFPTLEDLPSRTVEGEAVSSIFSPVPPAKRSRLSERSVLGDSILKAMESVSRRSSMHTIDVRMSLSQNISADMLSLLQTPKVKRRRRPDSRPDGDATLTDTPQSILKVRQMVQRPLSPSAASDASVPVFPRLSARKAKISAAATAAIAEESAAMKRSSVDTSLTPKQLRFHLPKVQIEEESPRAKGAAPLAPPADQSMEEEEEDAQEEEGEEEEVVEEEEVGEEEEEEVVEEEVGEEEAEEDEQEKEIQSAADVEEETQREVERKPTSSFVLQRHEADPGIPSPRQPLHGLPTGSTSTLFSQKIETKKLVYGSSKEEEQKESDELASRETSLNDMFYSFEEEEDASTAKTEEEVQAAVEETEEDEEEEDVERNYEGTEISVEVMKTCKEVVMVGDASEDEIHEKGGREEETEADGTSEATNQTDTQDAEPQTFDTNIEKMEQEEEQQKEAEESPEPSIADDVEVEDAKAEPEVHPINQEVLSKVMSKIEVPEKDKKPPSEDEYTFGKRGEGAMREDEGFSEEIEPPTETEEGQDAEVDVEVEISSPGRVVLADVESKEQKLEESEEKQEREENVLEGEEESTEGEKGEMTPPLKTVETAVEMQGETLEKEEEEEEEGKEKEREEEEKEEEDTEGEKGKVTPPLDTIETATEIQEEKLEKEEEERVQEWEEKGTEGEKGKIAYSLNTIEVATEMQDENIFNLEECVSGREKEEDSDHCITTQEEEMIADAVSEGAEELYLNLGTDDDLSPGVSRDGDDKDSKDVEGEKDPVVQDADVGDAKIQLKGVKIQLKRIEEDSLNLSGGKAGETHVVHESYTQQTSEEIALVSSMKEEAEAVDRKLTVDGNELARDKDEEMMEVEDAGSATTEKPELHTSTSTPVEHTVAGSEGKQLDEVPMEEGAHRDSLSTMEKENEESKKMDETGPVTTSTEQVIPTPQEGQVKVVDVQPVGKDPLVSVSEAEATEKEKKDVQKNVSQVIEEAEILVTRETVEKEEDIEMVDGNVKQISVTKAESAATLTESVTRETMEEERGAERVDEDTQQPSTSKAENVIPVIESDQEPTAVPEDRVVVEGPSSSSSAPSPVSVSHDSQDTMSLDANKLNEKSPSVVTSSDHSEDSQALTPRRSTRHTPTREQITTPLRRSRRLSEASNSSAPPTPKRSTKSKTPSREEVQDTAPLTPRRSTRSTTPVREEMQGAPLERVTRSGRKIIQVPTPLIRSKGSPGSPLLTPGRTRRLSGSQESGMEKVTQKLQLTPEHKAEDKDASPSRRLEEPSSAGTPSVPPTPPLATPTRRSTRRSQVEALETISEDSEVVRPKSEGRARTPSRDSATTTTTPSKATPRRSRRLSTTETLETIAEDSVLATKEEPLTPATPKRSSRRSMGPHTSAAPLTTPKKRRASLGSESEEPSQVKTPRRTRQSSGDAAKKTPERRTPSRRKKVQSPTSAEGAVQEADKGSSSFVIPEEGRSTGSRTRKQSISEESTPGGERGRLDSLTSVPESPSASPARSTPLTSIKDSESSEEDDRKIRQAGKQKQGTEGKEKGQSVQGKEGVKRRKSRLLIHTSAFEPLHLDLPKPPRKSLRTMKLYRDSEENDKYVSESEKKRTKRVSRTRKSLAASQLSPSSSPLLLLGSREDKEAGMSSKTDMIELTPGLDTENESALLSSHAQSEESPEMELSLLKVGGLTKSTKTRKSIISLMGQGKKRGTQRRRTFKVPRFTTTDEEESSNQPQDADSKSTRRISRTTRKSRASAQFSSPSSPLLLLNIDGKEVNVDVTSDSQGAEVKVGPDIARKEVSSPSEGKPQESQQRKQDPQRQGGKKRGRGQGQDSTAHSGKEDEGNTITTTTTSNTIITTVATSAGRSPKSKQSLSSATTSMSTTNTELDLRLGEEKEPKVGEERVEPQLLGKEEDGTVKEERTKGHEGGAHREPLESNTRKDSDDKGSTEEAGATAPLPQFKFAKPKAVSSKRQMRALEDLTSEAVNFLFSAPLAAAGRNAKEQTTTEKSSSSSESEAKPKSRRTSQKKH